MNGGEKMLLADQAARLETTEVTQKLGTSSERGLSSVQVTEKRRLYGTNELNTPKPPPIWKRYLAQFKDPLIGLLLGSALVSVLTGQFADAISIFVALIIVVSVGFIQEYRSEQALEKLTKLVPPKALVVRDGREVSMLALELVAGDLVILKTGDRVPADIRLITQNGFLVDESSMTGEPEPMAKNAESIVVVGTSQTYSNMAYMGCLVLSGNCRGIVTATGENSQFGEMVKLLSQEEPPRTPLQVSMDKLGQQLSFVSFGVIGFIFLIGMIQGKGVLEMFTMGVSLAVAAIPEGLPIVVTVTLALGVLRMASHQAVVRRLPAVETLGSVDVICSDKTGTLTKGSMAVTEALLSDGSRASIGQLVMLHGEVQHGRSHPLMEALTTACVVCNNVQPTYGKKRTLGNPTEAALMGFAQKLGLEDLRNDWMRVKEIPFTSDSKTMAVQAIYNRDPEQKPLWFVKGAPEILLEKCFLFQTRDGRQNMTTKTRISLNDHATYMMNQGLRVLALAKGEKTPDELIFLGLVGISDPPRPSASKAVAELRKRGVELKMITGDARETALAIAAKLGIGRDFAVSGEEISTLDETELTRLANKANVFYRTSPQHKLKIVKSLQMCGRTVGMVGDGVNDAVAVKKADIGISMGINGTDVCREAADMVLLDDNLQTIVPAIEEGKSIFYNIRNFVTFQLSTSIAALSLIAISTILGLPSPLNAMQVLWINILMDGPPAQSLGLEPSDPDLTKGKPRPRGEKLLNKGIIKRILINATLILSGTFWVLRREYLDDGRLSDHERTMTFTCFVFFDMMNALACRSQTKSIRHLPPNKPLFIAVSLSILGQLLVVYWAPLQSVFQTQSLSFGDMATIILISSSVLVTSEWMKYKSRPQRKQSMPSALREVI